MKNDKARIFLLVCVAAVLLVAGYLAYVRQRIAATDAQASAPAPEPVTPHPAVPVAPPPATAAAPVDNATPAAAVAPPAPVPQAPQRLFFRSTDVRRHYGSVAWVDVSRPREIHFVDSLRCEVVYTAGGSGICLSADRGVFTTYAASLFETRKFKVSGRFALKGIPSRARVSLDGRLAALTVFVSGHGYTTLDFSTQSLIVDVKTAAVLADLESFEVRRGGEVIKAADFNFWGVTFTADARQFYATLSTAGQHLLVRGDIGGRTAEVLHENVECPSLSPDGRHIAYKKRLQIDNRISWQLHVLELASGRETALSEKRSIDDQLEWLDDQHVLYSVPHAADDSSPSTDVWSAAIDARTPPALFVPNAYSPARERGTGGKT